MLDILDYIHLHKEEVEKEYQEVLQSAERNRKYWEERNREVMGKTYQQRETIRQVERIAGAISRGKQIMKVLLDHHMKKQGILLWATMGNEGWLKLLDIPMLTFDDVGLPIDSNDRDVWRFSQTKQLILLTGNRNKDGAESLEQTIRDENTPNSLPVITVGIINGLEESAYREQCAERLVEIILNIENYLGIGRIYIP